MCWTNEFYRYKKLKEGYIRVLSLRSSPQAPILSYRISTQRIIRRGDCEPFSRSYLAISYTWAHDYTKTETILCNGRRLKVTKNLVECLRTIHSAYDGYDKNLRFWVDAICIDQDEKIDKARQVAQIHDIFRCAWGVSIWLGPPENDSDEAMKWIPKLCDRLDHIHARIPPEENYLLKYDLPPRDDPVWPALGRLWIRKWFRRVWVLQEVGIARRQHVKVICGTYHVDFNDMLWLDYLLTVTGLRRLLSYKLNKAEREQFRRYRWYPFNRVWQRGLLTLSEIWFFTRHLECTEQVDRVYGMRGLIPGNLRNQIKVDYTPKAMKQYWELYLKVAVLALHTEPDLKLLQFAVTQMTPSLPSWCPDLVTYQVREHILYVFQNPTHLADDIPENTYYEAGTSIDPTHPKKQICYQPGEFPCLTVAGVALDIITETIDLETYQSPVVLRRGALCRAPWAHEGVDFLTKIQVLAEEAFDVAGTPYEQRSEILARTLVTFMSSEHLPRDFDCGPSLRRLMSTPVETTYRNDMEFTPDMAWQRQQSFLTDTEKSTDMWFRNRITTSWYAKAFFITKNGHIGLCSSMAEQGDTVVVLFGGGTPFVLKKDGGTSTTWGFQEAAYLYGFMQGEVFGLIEQGKLKKQLFKLK